MLIILIVFGVGKLPQVGGAIGKAIREFRKAQRDDYDEDEKLTKTDFMSTDMGRGILPVLPGQAKERKCMPRCIDWE